MVISLRYFILTVLALAPLLRAADTPAPTSRPNILLISVDDLNHWVGHLGRNTQVLTPNIDRLAARGVSFERAYCASSVCNPSRTALLTGMRPSTTGVYGNNTDWRTVIPDGYTLPGTLRRGGYFTFGVGKLFHTSRHIREGDWDRYVQNPRDESLHQVENSNASTAGDESTDAIRYKAGELSIAELPGGDDSVGDYFSASAAIEAIGTTPADKPFFIACGIFRPHLPWHVPKNYFDLYPEESIELPPTLESDLDDVPDGRPTPEHIAIIRDGMSKKAVRAYMACITYADAQIGRILDALDQSPARDNTIVVLWGDHGWFLGEKQRWRKTMLWEEGARMPYVWAGPGIARGSRVSAPVDLMSVYPTLLALADFERPAHVEGTSIVPLLRDPAAVWDGPPALTTWHFNNHTVRTDRWRYLRWDNGNEELYDHDVDPYEWYNLLHPSNAVRAEALDLPALRAQLAAHFPKINRTTDEGRAFFGTTAAQETPAAADDAKAKRQAERRRQRLAEKEETP